MATKSKEELLTEARELGLDVSEENTVAELKAKIAEAKPSQENVSGDEPQESGEAPESAYPDGNRDNGAGVGREPQVAKEPAKSFEERTGVGTPPWLNEDGSQNTGEEATEE